MMTDTQTSYEGVLAILKPAGWTSHDVVAKVRRIIRERRIGHTGTLDPQVTGVLPLCIGRATRLVEYIQDLPKQYEATLTLGYSTDTEDSTGEVTERADEVGISKEQLTDALMSFLGTIKQLPPMYSAVKVDGKRLYELARQGKEVEREARTVHIYGIEPLQFDMDKPYPEVRFQVTCSKGTYIRTLCVDIGRKLGLPAVMSNLVRTRTGPISIGQCFTIEQVEEHIREGSFPSLLIPSDKAIEHIPSIALNEVQTKQCLQGQQISLNDDMAEDVLARTNSEVEPLLRTYASDGSFIGVFVWSKHMNRLKPVKVFN
jgi:tRNA pseudouridine55 synthase